MASEVKAQEVVIAMAGEGRGACGARGALFALTVSAAHAV